MRILFVAQDFPWPARLGTHLRSQQVIASLAPLGELDVFSLIYPNRADPCERGPGSRSSPARSPSTPSAGDCAGW